MLRQRDHKANWLLANPHVQTIGSSYLLRQPTLYFLRERIETPDYDFFDVDWLKQAESNASTPLLIIQHGLEGSTNSGYVKRLSKRMFEAGYDVAAVNFRGCSGEHNQRAYSYNAGFYQDLQQLLLRERALRSSAEIHLAGVSLGAAAILSMADHLQASGLEADQQPFNKLALISVPLDLSKGLQHMEKGFSRIYDNYFTQSLVKKYVDKFRSRTEAVVPVGEAAQIKTLRAFDNRITAPLSGYKDGEDYYAQNRPLDRLEALQQLDKRIGVFMASDDPMVNPEAIATLRDMANHHFDVSIYPKGGHVGFIAGWMPKLAKQWVIDDVCQWLLDD